MGRRACLRTLLLLLLVAMVGGLAGARGAEAETLDAVFANYGQRNRVCVGDGTGGFTCSDVSTDADNTRGVALGFVDGDSNMDAVFANYAQRNRVCLGDGVGGFTCSDVSTDGLQHMGVALGFVDGDSNLDAVFAVYGWTQRNRVCLGDGAGGFTCSDLGTAGMLSMGVALGDVNGDSNLDAAFPTYNTDSSHVCLGDGAGGFTCSVLDLDMGTRDTFSVALGFVDGDSNLDAVLGGGAAQGYSYRNRLCLGAGTGSFSCSNIGAAVYDVNSDGVALGFVDGDGNLDAVFADDGQQNRVCLGDGAGGFTCSHVTGAYNTRGVALGFVDGDGNLDAVFANGGGFRDRVCLGDGAGGFTCTDVSADVYDSRGVALGEVVIPPTPTPTVTPTPTPTSTPTPPLCAPAPLGACRTPGKSIFLLKDKTVTGPDPDKSDKILWKWLKGEPTSQAEFGDPRTTAKYALCVYAGTTGTLVAEATVPPDPMKWQAISTKGYKYKDNDGVADGVERIVLKGSAENKARVVVKGKGASVPMPELPLTPPVTTQLVNSDTAVCWQAVYGIDDIIKNEPVQFKAKVASP